MDPTSPESVVVTGLSNEKQLDQIRLKLQTLNLTHTGDVEEQTGKLYLKFQTSKAAVLSVQVINYE